MQFMGNVAVQTHRELGIAPTSRGDHAYFGRMPDAVTHTGRPLTPIGIFHHGDPSEGAYLRECQCTNRHISGGSIMVTLGVELCTIAKYTFIKLDARRPILDCAADAYLACDNG